MIWLLAGLLAALAVAGLLRPLFTAPSARLAREDSNVLAYRQRRDELAIEHEAGLIDAATHAAALAELDRRLLDETGAREPVAVAGRGRGRLLVVLLAALIVPLALLGYGQAGSWRVQQRVSLAQSDPVAAMRVVTDDLAAALQSRPEAEGYALLGSMRAALREPERAARAYAEANRLADGQQADWLVAEAEMLAAVQNRDLRGRPYDLLVAALALEPAHIRALWFIGVAELQQGDRAAAVGHWRRLEALGELPAELREVLAERLDELDPGGAPAALLTVEVTLAAAYAGRAGAGSTLFVFARDPDGPPMPIAALRAPAPQFPMTVTLDDRHSLDPARPLSAFAAVALGARLTHGDAAAASGDVESLVTVVSVGEGPAALHLVQERP